MRSMWDDEDKKIQALIDDHPKLKAWLQTKCGKSLLDTIGVSTRHADQFVLPLAHLTEFFGGRFRMFKDDIDRARCDVLTDYVQGTTVDEKELLIAVSLLMQSYNAAIERLWRIQQQRIPHPPRPYGQPPRPVRR